MQELDYRSNVRRVIYIEDVLYTLGYYNIISYDLNTFEKLNELKLDDESINDLIVE